MSSLITIIGTKLAAKAKELFPDYKVYVTPDYDIADL